MSQIHRIPILIPLALGAVAVVCTVLIHALVLNVSLSFVRRERRLGRAGKSFWIDVAIVSLAVLFGFVAHLVGIGLWAGLFVFCGEFSAFGAAYYHSAVNYTTLGYGDVIMSPSWKLLGPLEAANGALMFGVSTAIVFALVQRLILDRFADLN
jgi:Ion channel